MLQAFLPLLCKHRSLRSSDRELVSYQNNPYTQEGAFQRRHQYDWLEERTNMLEPDSLPQVLPAKKGNDGEKKA